MLHLSRPQVRAQVTYMQDEVSCRCTSGVCAEAACQCSHVRLGSQRVGLVRCRAAAARCLTHEKPQLRGGLAHLHAEAGRRV